MLIYCIFRVARNAENRKRCMEIVNYLQYNDMDNLYLAPQLVFGELYDDFDDYTDILPLCFKLLDNCDKVLVLSQPSPGTIEELDYASEHFIPIEFAYDA